ncbi:MAG TPA: hypothetical protein VG433_15395, partial [Pirellulales bacterium]|nr:hypothetical protein [Pirellulales bacterium]
MNHLARCLCRRSLGSIICLAGLVGCGGQAPPPTAAVPSARAKTANRGGDTGAKQEGEPGGAAGDDDAPAEGDTEWQACYLHGEKIGYAAITTRHVDGPGRSQLEIASRNHMSIRRFGNQNTIDVETTSLETAA